MYSNTGLRLTFNGNGRERRKEDRTCCAWYFLINGAICSNPGSVNAVIEDTVETVNQPKQFTSKKNEAMKLSVETSLSLFFW